MTQEVDNLHPNIGNPEGKTLADIQHAQRHDGVADAVRAVDVLAKTKVTANGLSTLHVTDSEPQNAAEGDLWVEKSGASVGHGHGEYLPRAGGDMFGGIRLPDGTLAAPSYSFVNYTGTGFSSGPTDRIVASVGGIWRVAIESSGLSINNPIRVTNGTAAAPSFSFMDDNDTGIYRSAADQMAFATGGSWRFFAENNRFVTSVPVHVIDGSAAAPSYTFGSSPTTGLYQETGNRLNFSASGVRRAFIQMDQFNIEVPVRAPNGTDSAPSYAFGSDAGLGMRGIPGEQVIFVVNANPRVAISSTHLYPWTDNQIKLGESNRRYTQVWATTGTIQTSDVKEKRDIEVIERKTAAERVKQVAQSAIEFKWNDGTRTHAGFDAEAVSEVIEGHSAAYIDPAVEARERVNPYVNEPDEEWLDKYDDEQTAVDEWTTARERFDEETELMLQAPKGLRYAEMIPDLYAAVAELLEQNAAMREEIDKLKDNG
jgi:hypothetical protein